MQSEDSDQTGRMPTLIRVSAVPGAFIFCWFCHALSHLCSGITFLRICCLHMAISDFLTLGMPGKDWTCIRNNPPILLIQVGQL